MKSEIDKAVLLMGDFEKKTGMLGGLNALSEALFIISDVISSGNDIFSVKRAENLFISYKRMILKAVHKLLGTPENFSYPDFEYWYSVLQEVIHCTIGNNDDLFLLEPSVSKLKEKARWESLSRKQQHEEVCRLFRKLPKEKQEEIIRELSSLKKAS